MVQKAVEINQIHEPIKRMIRINGKLKSEEKETYEKLQRYSSGDYSNKNFRLRGRTETPIIYTTFPSSGLSHVNT